MAFQLQPNRHTQTQLVSSRHRAHSQALTKAGITWSDLHTPSGAKTDTVSLSATFRLFVLLAMLWCHDFDVKLSWIVNINTHSRTLSLCHDSLCWSFPGLVCCEMLASFWKCSTRKWCRVQQKWTDVLFLWLCYVNVFFFAGKWETFVSWKSVSSEIQIQGDWMICRDLQCVLLHHNSLSWLIFLTFPHPTFPHLEWNLHHIHFILQYLKAKLFMQNLCCKKNFIF